MRMFTVRTGKDRTNISEGMYCKWLWLMGDKQYYVIQLGYQDVESMIEVALPTDTRNRIRKPSSEYKMYGWYIAFNFERKMEKEGSLLVLWEAYDGFGKMEAVGQGVRVLGYHPGNREKKCPAAMLAILNPGKELITHPADGLGAVLLKNENGVLMAYERIA